MKALTIAVQGVGGSQMSCVMMGFYSEPNKNEAGYLNGGSAPSRSTGHILNRGGDSDAYTEESIRKRLTPVLINGLPYNPFDEELIPALASDLPRGLTPVAAPKEVFKKSSSVDVSPNIRRSISPAIRLPELVVTNFRSAIAEDLASYSLKVKQAVEDDRRRRLLLWINN